MILITGASGQLGTAVIQQLLKKTSADQVAALVRDENKASSFQAAGVSVRVGHYDDAASLDAAMQGMERVLLIAGTDEQKRVQQHQNVVDAAKKAGVRGVAYTSRTIKDTGTLVNQLMLGHFQTEDLIRASGLQTIIFRNVLYMDTLPQFVGERVFESGIHLPVGAGRAPFALRSEMGEAIANALLESGVDNSTYHLTGSESYSFHDVATVLSNLSGQAVSYFPTEEAEFRAQLRARSLPDLVIERIVGFLTDLKNGQEDEISPDLERLLGRKPVSLQEGLKTLFKL